MAGLKIGVVGATGFVGGRICEYASAGLLEEPIDTIPIVRSWQKGARLARLGLTARLADVLDEASIAQSLSGLDAVINCALGPSEVSTQGVTNILRAAKQAGVAKVVHLSTIDVYTPTPGEVDETAPLRKQGTPYAMSKVAAEKACAQHAMEQEVTILRPGIIYGPFGKLWTVRPAARLQEGFWPNARRFSGTCNAIHVDDVAGAALRCAMHPREDGAVFNVVGPESPTWQEYYERLAAACHLRFRRESNGLGLRMRASVAGPLKRMAGKAQEKAGGTIASVAAKRGRARDAIRLVRSALELTPNQNELGLYGLRMRMEGHQLQRALGWAPEIGLERGLRNSAQWLAAQGMIPGGDSWE